MKAVKINMNGTENSGFIKSVIAGATINILIIFICTLVLSLIMNLLGNLFEDFAGYIMLLPLVIGGYTGGFIGARINKTRGMFVGALCSASVFILMLIIGFCANSAEITYMLILKAVALILPSVIGGIKGVNKKEKFKV